MVAYTCVRENQKKGLPHIHMLLILHPTDKLKSCDQFDQAVFAEIPDCSKNPELHAKYVRHMIHADCENHPDLPCRVNGHCRYYFPADYQEFTTQNADGYPFYRRRSVEQGGLTYVSKISFETKYYVYTRIYH